jgi:uncharacterized protein (DUF302 family)
MLVYDAMMIDGLISLACNHPTADAADRLERAVSSRGMHVFARVDHAAGAAGVGLQLAPTIVVMFGDPRAGTLVMQSVHELGLELPLKMLCWTDANGASKISYTDPRWLGARFGVDAANPVIAKMHALLAELAGEVAA